MTCLQDYSPFNIINSESTTASTYRQRPWERYADEEEDEDEEGDDGSGLWVPEMS